MCRNSTKENKNRYESMENNVKKADSKAMREKSLEMLTEEKNCPNRMHRLVKESKIAIKEVEWEDV